jgi:excisionase family DNA binding protein
MRVEKGVPVTFSVEETARILGCSRSQVYVLLRTNELGSIQIRGSRRITENQIVRFVTKLEGN